MTITKKQGGGALTIALEGHLDTTTAPELEVETIVDAEIRQRLLSASSSGKNEASRSFMGKLREFFFRGPDENIATYQTPLVNAGIAANVKEWQWSMARYQENISAAKDEKPEAAEAWGRAGKVRRAQRGRRREDQHQGLDDGNDHRQEAGLRRQTHETFL